MRPRVSDDHWLKSSKSAAPASRRIAETSQFTIVVDDCASDDLSLNGPGRIATISAGTNVRNLTVGQEGDHLAVRVRTLATGENGTAPQVEVIGVFTDSAAHRIVVTYNDTVLVTYIDGRPQGRLQITPEAALIWRMYPRDMWRIRIDNAGFGSYAIVYRMLGFVPLGALLVATMNRSRLKGALRWTLISAGVLVAAISLELVIARLTSSGFETRNLVTSLCIATVTIATISVARAPRGIPYRQAIPNVRIARLKASDNGAEFRALLRRCRVVKLLIIQLFSTTSETILQVQRKFCAFAVK